MENQINNQQGEKHISTIVGVSIIVVILIIVIFVIWVFNNNSAPNVPVVTAPVSTQIKEPVKPSNENDLASPDSGNADSQTVIDNTPIDFDKELKDLDAGVNSVDSNDFGDTGLSDANLGL